MWGLKDEEPFLHFPDSRELSAQRLDNLHNNYGERSML